MTRAVLKIEQLEQLLHHLATGQITTFDGHDSSLSELCQPLLQEAAIHLQESWAAHMTPALAPYSLLASQIATLHSGNLLSAELYPLLHQAQESTSHWLCQRFQQNHALFTHGGSYANLEALWRARDASRSPSTIVYGSHATHYSVGKACQLLGLNFQAIETDNQDRMDIDSLRKACHQQEPVAIVFNAGSSALGSLDSIDDIVSIAKEMKCWLHIDAAWGGALMLLPEHQDRFASLLQQADSITFDPHKALFQPKPCSVLLSKTAASCYSDVGYLTSSPQKRLSGSYGGELFLPLWLNLQMLGENWFFQQIRLRLSHASQFARQLSALTDWPVVCSETGIVTFETPQPGQLQPLVEQGLFSTARLQHRVVYRAVFASTQTKPDTLIRSLHPFL